MVVTAWTLVLMSACPLIPYRASYMDTCLVSACPLVLYRAGYDMDTCLVSACPLVLYRARYDMDTRLDVCMPFDPIPCWLLHGHTSWYLHAS